MRHMKNAAEFLSGVIDALRAGEGEIVALNIEQICEEGEDDDGNPIRVPTREYRYTFTVRETSGESK